MANPQHLAIARQGKGAWNDWQAGAGMGVRVDFTGANFIELEKAARDSDPDFLGYDFSGFVFSGDADFIDAVFSGLPTDRSLDPGKAAEGGVPLKGGANFDRAVFGGNARFQRAVFGGTPGSGTRSSAGTPGSGARSSAGTPTSTARSSA